ncbi:MAG: hypothetical protein ETSY1_42800 [Candidatus Entotheonella factor]|uniref:Uncharacterized protein n=1 Tax=Entotheonella factor TaxID=1429438 RepID=W4L3F6_ENTF1|nr:hypothetical protein [Candidatus Entotheonella palauensis]ETW92633.1 MAG: hypothetical protein ETSY1_42800 [Candidatus Entotheonella factor]
MADAQARQRGQAVVKSLSHDAGWPSAVNGQRVARERFDELDGK